MFNLLDFNDDGYSKYETIASELKYVQDISENNLLESKKIGFFYKIIINLIHISINSNQIT